MTAAPARSGRAERWIVVGAGSAGCVVARRLSDDPWREVVLLDAGPDLTPGDLTDAISGPDHLRGVGTAVAPERWRRRRLLGSGSPVYDTGSGIGGSSVVNGLVAHRGDPGQYAAWGWGDVDAAWASVLVPTAPAWPDELGPVDRALLASDARARVVALTRRAGRRVTSAEAYLWPVRDRANLVVRPRSEAISVRSSTAGGVEVVMTAGERLEGSHVVLCSGAIDTAAILLRSGLGGPLAGRGLQDHPAAVVDLGLRTASAGGLVTGVTSEHDGVQVLAMNHVGTDGPHAALVVSLLDPVGTGHVELLHNDGPGGDSGDDRAADDRDADDRAADEDDVVVVHPGVSHPHDASRLAAAVRRVGSLVATEPFQAIVADVGSAPFDASDAEVVEWLRRQPLIVRHASSTCATGAVVDERGRVLRDGSPASVDEHIRVCDASSFPSVPHGNPHLPVTMAAERLVAMWRTAVR